jgi:hypothetical protein
MYKNTTPIPLKSRWSLPLAVAFIGAVVACPVWYFYAVHETEKAIQGEWDTVEVVGPGFGGDWRFSTNGIVITSSGYATHYSVNPLFSTITIGEGGYTYALDGNTMKIWVRGETPVEYTLKKVVDY